MTITKHDAIAIIPKRCDKCNRLFWLEHYDFFYKMVGVEYYSFKQIKCIECIEAESEDQMNFNTIKQELHKKIKKMSEDEFIKFIEELKRIYYKNRRGKE